MIKPRELAVRISLSGEGRRVFAVMLHSHSPSLRGEESAWLSDDVSDGSVGGSVSG
jgi:hypothetical protein